MALYLEHFGLSEPPFRITPHTDFFFDGADRGATLEGLIYAILHDEGIVKVSGEVGSGKTMLCRVLMERLPERVETIYLATPSLARDEILHAIADELDLKFSQSRTSVALRELQEHLIRLYAAGQRVVILVDEAHAMPEETLEQIRLLSNLESNRHKLLQIVLFGQPELDATLAKPSLRQLRDRITHAFRTRPLSQAEVGNYISFRMRAAGYRGPEVFPAGAAARIARASGGLTRRINILADKALLAAFTENTHGVTERHVRAAIKDSEFPVPSRARPVLYAGAALAAGIALGAGIHAVLSSLEPAVPVREPPQASKRIFHGAAPATPGPAPVANSPTPAAGAPAAATAASATAVAPAAVPRAAASAAEREREEAAVEDEEEEEALAEALAAPSAPLLSSGQSRRINGYSAAGQKLLSERLAATRELLERSPAERYSIELFIAENSDPARTERFLVRARDWVPLGQLYVIPMLTGKHYRLRVVFGEYDDRSQALAAANHLPPRYRQAFRTAPRSLAELRGAL